MKYILLYIYLFTLTFGQQTPTRVKETPKAYSNPLDSMEVSSIDIVPFQAWKAYSDRDENSTYLSPNPSSLRSEKKLSFMEQVWVTDETDKYVRLAKGEQNNLQLDPGSEDLFWIEKNKMLLWSRCLSMHQGKIPIKVLFVNSSDTLKTFNSFLNPGLNSQKKNNGEKSIIYFLMKSDNDYSLLSKNETINAHQNDRLFQVIGWIKNTDLVFWRNRIAFEPNWEITNKTTYDFSFFESSIASSARNKYKNKIYLKLKKTVFENRLPGEWRRFIFLNYSDSINTARVVLMDPILYSKNGFLNDFTKNNNFICFTSLESLVHVPLYKKVLFLTNEELYDIRSTISTLVQRGSIRQDFAEAWKKVIKTYIGSLSDSELEKYTLSEWQEKLLGLPSSSPILKSVKIGDILNRVKLPDSDMQSVITVMKAKANELEKIYRMPTGGEARHKYSFRSNDITYYWIDEDMIP